MGVRLSVSLRGMSGEDVYMGKGGTLERGDLGA